MNVVKRLFLITIMVSAVFVIVISGVKITTAIQRGIRSEQEDMKEASLTGISQQDRKQIYTDLVEAGEKAKLDADKIHPTAPLHPNYRQDNAVKNLDMSNTLGNNYREEVRDKWGITEGQQRLIMGEQNTGVTIPIKQQSSTGITESLPGEMSRPGKQPGSTGITGSLSGEKSLPIKDPGSTGITESLPGAGSPTGEQPDAVEVTESRPGEGTSLLGVESPSEDEHSVERRQEIQDESLQYDE